MSTAPTATADMKLCRSAVVWRHNLAMFLGRRLLLILACGLAVLSGCAKRPHLHGQVTLHLMADRDFAQILLAHCETGIELTQAIASMNVNKDVALIADAMRRSEESDRAAILSWIASQTAQSGAVGLTHQADIKASHAVIAEQLRSTNTEHLDEHVLRVLVSHHDDELAIIRKTPVKDKTLRKTVESIRRRLSDDLKLLTRWLPSSQAPFALSSSFCGSTCA